MKKPKKRLSTWQKNSIAVYLVCLTFIWIPASSLTLQILATMGILIFILGAIFLENESEK